METTSKNPYNQVFEKLGNNLHNIVNNLRKFLSNPKNKKKFLSGLKDGKIYDDKEVVKTVVVKASQLKPSQSAIYLKKILGVLITFESFRDEILSGIVVAKDIFISMDGFIIDGHHRWATIMSTRPNAKIVCTVIKLPIKIAIPVLNAILLVTNKFKPGSEDNTNIWSQSSPEEIQTYIEDIVDNGGDGGFKAAPKELFEKNKHSKILTPGGNALDGLYHLIYKNAKLTPHYIYRNIKKIPKPLKIFGKRNQMPQIDGSGNMTKALRSGKIDISRPSFKYENLDLKNTNLVLEKLIMKSKKWKQKIIQNLIK